MTGTKKTKPISASKRKEKLKKILLNSENIFIESKKGSTMFLKCGNCGTQFKVFGYMKRSKFVCPTCKNKKLAERRMEKRQQIINGPMTSIRRKCDNMPYCFTRGIRLCDECLIETRPFYSKEEFASIINSANKTVTVTGNFVDSKTPIAYKCNICGTENKAKPHDLLRGSYGCKKCRQSTGERLISLYLFEHNIKFEIEKTFDGCENLKPLRFDFYLPEYNSVIEFDGRHHFEPTRYSRAQNPSEVYVATKKNDSIKNKFCKENGIRLLRIHYENKDIYGTLDGFLAKHHND